MLAHFANNILRNILAHFVILLFIRMVMSESIERGKECEAAGLGKEKGLVRKGYVSNPISF